MSQGRLGVQWMKDVHPGRAGERAGPQGQQERVGDGEELRRSEKDPAIAQMVQEVMGVEAGSENGKPSAEECMILKGVDARTANLKKAACTKAKMKATKIGMAGQRALFSMKNSYKQEIWMQEEKGIESCQYPA